jgi:hypothetical protein
MKVAFDHLALAAGSLDDASAIAAQLGVQASPGGRHAAMGTHNLLWSLGPGEYLELIAVDPEAVPPGRPRWFGLDRFAGPPRPVHWIARTADLDGALAVAPAGVGQPLALARGDLAWRITVPDDGTGAFGGAFPALIGWQGAAHPAQRLPDHGLRLVQLDLVHPDPAALSAALAPLVDDPRIVVAGGAAPGLRATVATPAGLRVLG